MEIKPIYIDPELKKAMDEAIKERHKAFMEIKEHFRKEAMEYAKEHDEEVWRVLNE